MVVIFIFFTIIEVFKLLIISNICLVTTTGERDALDANQLRLKFERSNHALKQAQFKEHNVLGEFSPNAKRSHGSTLQDVNTILGRAFYIKMREYEVLQRGFGSSIIVGLLVGYMYVFFGILNTYNI
jgi:hypothetical protein